MKVGEKKTPESFRNSCDEFVFLENIEGEIKESLINQVQNNLDGKTESGDIANEEEKNENIDTIHNLLEIASNKYWIISKKVDR